MLFRSYNTQTLIGDAFVVCYFIFMIGPFGLLGLHVDLSALRGLQQEVVDRRPPIDPSGRHCQYARLSFEYKQHADHGDDVVVSYGIPITVARVGGSDDIFSSQISPWITSFFALSLTTNVLATSECLLMSSLHENFPTSPFPLRTSSHTVYTVQIGRAHV